MVNRTINAVFKKQFLKPRHFSLFFVILLIAVTPGILVADVIAPEPQSLLKGTSQALREQNYHGRITYEYSGKLQVIELSHAVFDGREYEKVVYLNGPERALVKTGRQVSCETHGGRLLTGGIVQFTETQIASLGQSYHLKILGEERVAGHDSWVIQLVPKDALRHSTVLAVDKTTLLPTKTLVITKGRKVLERLHFVSLQSEVNFSREEFLADEIASAEAHNVNCVGQSETVNANDELEKQKEKLQAEWGPSWLPPGFVFSSYKYSSEDGHIETYTDGLASFSVFTRALDAEYEKNLNLTSSIQPPAVQKGATVVLMKMIGGVKPVHISVLGEIPADTANQVLTSVSQR